MNPNDIVGTPREYDVWLAPDWSNWSEKTKQTGWTRVSVRETLYANGRKVTEVLDENRQPITTRTLDETVDKDQEKRFKDAEAAATPPGGQTTRTINGQVMQWNPQTRAYDILTNQTPATTSNTKEWRTEGRPDGKGGWDNTRPIMAAYVNGQRTGETREPDGKELRDWNEAQQRSRNPGGKSDEEMQRDADRNKPGAPTLKPDGKGGTIAVQTMPDGTIKTTPLPDVPSDKPTPERVTVEGVVYERGADGTYKPAAGIPAPTKGGKLPPGVKPPTFTRGNVAAELTRFNQELDQAVGRGEISKEDATGFYTTYHQAAQTFLSEQNNSDNQDAAASGQQLTQRSQNMTQAGNRLNWANSTFQNAANADQQMLLGAAGTGRSALVPLLTLQAGLANAAGGLRDQPEVEVRRYPASIQPVAAATNAAAPAAGGKPAPLINPTQPVSAAQASAVAAQARARDAGGVPTPGEPGGPPLATPQPSPVPTPPPNAAASAATPTPADGNERDDDILTVQGQQGAAQQMTRAEYNALPANVRGSVVVTNAQPNPARFQQPAEQPPANGGWSEPTPAPAGSPTWDTYRPTPGSAPADPAFPDPTKPPLPPNEVTMAPPMPRSIQAAMPSAPGTPDIDSIAERMLADGADPMDVMEIRRRWKRGAAA